MYTLFISRILPVTSQPLNPGFSGGKKEWEASELNGFAA